MKNWIGIWVYGALLTIFWLFAVYSTSIWKSFDQGTRITLIQNIETVKAFNTLLDATILSSTQQVLNATPEQELQSPLIIGEEASSLQSPILWKSPSQLPVLKSETDSLEGIVIKKETTIKNRNNYKYFSNQVRSLIISIIIAFIVYWIPMNRLQNKKMIFMLLIWVTIFQLLVFIPGLQATYGTARGWVDLPWLPNMQPSEFFKMGYIFFMAYWISKRRDFIDSKEFLYQFAFINLIIFFILLLVPDFWTIFILGVSATIMSRYSGFSLKKISILAGTALIALIFGLISISLVMKNYRYTLVRLTTFMTTNAEEKQYQEQNEGRQIKQGLIAVWGGGLFGQWYGKGLQKMGYLPEAHSDMIFDAFSEEIGFVGNMILLALYFGLFRYVISELQGVRDPYLKLAGIGLVSLLMIQVFVHIGVNLEILPNTWLTLPFVSHGGTALMINIIELTLLYKIIRFRNTV